MMRFFAPVAVALAVIMTPLPEARACSIEGDQYYVHVELGPHDLWGAEIFETPMDGAAIFTMQMQNTDFGSAFSAVSVIVRDPEGVELPGSLELLPLYETGLDHDSGSTGGTGLLIWRPQDQLAPLTLYSAELRVDIVALTGEPDAWGNEVRVSTEEFRTTDELAPELALPEAINVSLTSYVASIIERVCCETTADSCGVAWQCETVRQRREPALMVTSEAAPLTYLWTAPVDDEGVVGAVRTVQEVYDGKDHNNELELVSVHVLSDRIKFKGAQNEYCVVVGATSMIDGDSVVSAPICVPHGELDAPIEENVDWSFSYGIDACLTPPVFESSNEPYAPTSGCQIDPSGRGGAPLGLLLIAALLGIRRRS